MPTQSNVLLSKLINSAVKMGASRLHLEVGAKPVMRVDQKLINLEDDAVITEEFLEDVVKLVLPEQEQKELVKEKSVVATYVFEGDIRFKVHAFYQKNNLSMIFTHIPKTIVEPNEIGLTQELIDLIKNKEGLLVIGGHHSSGRTTTALSLLNYINNTQAKYILTVENPVEYILSPQKSIVEQREIGRDTNDFLSSIKFCKDSDVDVVFLSEVNSYEVLMGVFDLVASGRLVIVVTEANSAADAVSELVNLAPNKETSKIREILADSLLGIVVQQLVPRRGGGQITVTEILISNSASNALIKEGRYSQLTSVIQMSREEGMRSLDQYLLELVKTGEVTYEDALSVAVDKSEFQTAAQKFRAE